MKTFIKKCMHFILNLFSKSPRLYDAVHRVFPSVAHMLYFSECSYATNLEDLIAKFYCNQHRGKKGGFYVDVGALDPFTFSNTYGLYLAGWKGINIEPRKDSIEKFNRYRKGDINLNVGVSLEVGELNYYAFEEPAYNTTVKVRADYVKKEKYSKLIDQYKIKTLPLENIFQQNNIPETGIDFLAIDVEGHELPVLQSNNWQVYRPFLIAMESLISKENGYDIKFLDRDPAVKYLLERDYKIVAKVRNKLFFMDSRE